MPPSPTTRAGLLAAGRSEVLTYGPDGQRRGEGMEVFVASYAPRPRMLVFGAIDFAAAVARQGSFLGYRVTVCDARPVFATAARFPTADEVVVDWPHRYLAAQAEAEAIDAPHRDLRAHPRPQVRCSAARGRAAAPRGRLRGGDGVAAHPPRPARAAARGRADRSRARPAVAARSGSISAPGPRRRPRCRSPPRSSPQVGRRGPPADRVRRPDPPRDTARV